MLRLRKYRHRRLLVKTTMANTFKNTTFRSPGALGNITIGIFGLLVVTGVLNVAISIFMIASPDSSIELDNGESVGIGLVMVGLVAIVEIAFRIFGAVFFLI